MTNSIDEFSTEFFQEVLTEADAGGRFAEDVFFEKFCDFLTEAGELDSADRASYRGPGNTGIRVDGYGGDPASASGTLTLIIMDFNQSPNQGRLVGGEMNAIFQRLTKFLQKSLSNDWRNSLEETSPGFGLADLISQRWKIVSRVRMLLISNRELSERVDGRNAEQFDERTVTYSVWDIKRLHRFATIGHGREEIEIDLLKDFGGALPLLPAHLSADDYESYLAVVPGATLAAIYDRWGARLLEQNVRVFLQARGNVNKGIRDTILNDPTMFFAYNNGITATAEAIETEEQGGQLVMTGLKNLQIVNGGQTTASIHAAYRSKTDLSRVFVQMKLSIVEPSRATEVVPRISEYANSQNRVNAADFFANHPFHVRMQEFSRRIYAPSPDGTFRETKWFYERARGQYADARSLLTPAQRKKFDLEHPRSQLFSKTDLAKYLNVWLGQPDKVSLGAQKNFAQFAHSIGQQWKKNEGNFNEGFYREAVAKAIVFKSTEKIVTDQPWYEGGYRANIVAYTIAKLAEDVADMKRAVDFSGIWKRQRITQAMENAIAHAAKIVTSVLVNPPSGISNVSEWAKKQACWARVKALKIEWPQSFVAELITLAEQKSAKRDAQRAQKVLNGIEAQMAVVQAGADFWKDVLQWGRERRFLSPDDSGILETASRIPNRLPTEAQSHRALEILRRLREDGCPHELELERT
jgi:hypothetical protein